MEPVPEAVVTENVKIRDGFAEKVKGTVIKATNARDAFAALVESGATVSKGRARELLGILDKVVMDLRDNAPFMVEQFQESAEKVVSQAKAEIEAFATHEVIAAGLERLAEQRGQVARAALPSRPPRNTDPVEFEVCDGCGQEGCEGCTGDGR